jgi:hypothetical protein
MQTHVNYAFDLSALLYPFWGLAVGFWEGLRKIWSNNTSYFWSFMVNVGGWGGRFVPMVIVAERGDATGCLVIFKY